MTADDRPPVTTWRRLDAAGKARVVEIARELYSDLSLDGVVARLALDHGVLVSRPTLRRALADAGVVIRPTGVITPQARAASHASQRRRIAAERARREGGGRT